MEQSSASSIKREAESMNPEPETKQPNGIFQPVTETETDIAFSGPAVFSNRFYISVSAVGARITFAEEAEGRPASFRTAVYLGLADATSLSKVLKALIKEPEAPHGEDTASNRKVGDGN